MEYTHGMRVSDGNRRGNATEADENGFALVKWDHVRAPTWIPLSALRPGRPEPKRDDLRDTHKRA
jgi:hypothetical protein